MPSLAAGAAAGLFLGMNKCDDIVADLARSVADSELAEAAGDYLDMLREDDDETAKFGDGDDDSAVFFETLGDDDSVVLPEEFCESEDRLSQEGLAMRPRPFCVNEETSRLFADQGRFDALDLSERYQMVNGALTTFRAGMRRCIRQSAGKKSLELGIGDHIDPGLSAIMTFNCGGDDEDRVDYELTASSYGLVPDNNLLCMESEITISRFWAGQIVVLSQSTDTCHAGPAQSRFNVAQRIEVKDAGLDADDGFVHERGFTYRTPEEYEAAVGLAIDEEGEPLPAPPDGPTALYALRGVLDDANGLFYSNESVELHPSYACPY